MKPRSKRMIILSIISLGVLFQFTGNDAEAQAPAPRPQMAEEVFKNVTMLKGIPVDEFMDTMGMFAASLGYDCASCHGGDISTDRANYAIETPNIQKARQMVLLVNSINGGDFAGRPLVSCFTCHRGQVRPESVPSLELQYAELKEDPSSMTLTPSSRVTVDQVFDKYMQALGGEARVAAMPPRLASAPGSMGKNRPSCLSASFSCLRVTPA